MNALATQRREFFCVLANAATISFTLCVSSRLGDFASKNKTPKLTLPNAEYQSYGSVLVGESRLVLAERSES